MEETTRAKIKKSRRVLATYDDTFRGPDVARQERISGSE